MRRLRKEGPPRTLLAQAKNSILNYVDTEGSRDALAGLRVVVQVQEQSELAQLRRQVATLTSTLEDAESKMQHARMAAPVIFARPHTVFFHARKDNDTVADEDYFCFLGMTHGDGRKGIGSSHEEAGLEKTLLLQREACYVFCHLCGEGAFGSFLDPSAWCRTVGHFDWRTEFVPDEGSPRRREFVVHPSRVAGFQTLTRLQWGTLCGNADGARKLRRITGERSDDASSDDCSDSDSDSDSDSSESMPGA
jgi:hypothetical protein